MNVRKIALLAICLFLLRLSALADSTTTTQRSVTQIAEGVYVIRHPDAPNEFPQGNTTVIIGSRAVLVVDSCYLPSSAKEDIAQIHTWTDKPVRYLVNTHWHFDHIDGNYIYKDAFPEVMIVAHPETQRRVVDYTPGYVSRVIAADDERRNELASGKDKEGKPLMEQDRADIAKQLKEGEPVEAEFKVMRVQSADVAFTEDMNIDLGNRVVQLKWLGLGNTRGDIVACLPKEKIVIAGDLLDHPVPYLGGGFPYELIGTLERLGRLDADTIVPGHGDVLHGREYLNQVIAMLRAVTEAVTLQVNRLGNGSNNLEAVQKGVEQSLDVESYRRQFAGDNKDDREFFDSFAWPGLIKAAYREAWGN